MKKLLSLIVLSLVMMTGLAWADGLETFNNFGPTENSYSNGSFVGDNSITWNYVQAAGSTMGTVSYPIDGNGMIMRRMSDNCRIYSDPIPGGIGNFSVQMRKAYTGKGERQIALYVNGDHIADSITFGSASGADSTKHTFSVSDINISGDVVIEIKNIQGTGSNNRHVTIDNILWTAYAPSDPSIGITTTTLNTFTYVLNYGASASQTVKVGVTNFTSGDVLNVSSSLNYEIKNPLLTGDYGTSLTFDLDGSPQTFAVDVRLKQGLEVGDHSGTLTFSVGSGDDEVEATMTLTGEVTAPPIVAPVANAAANIGDDSFTANWEASAGATEYFIDVYEMVVGGASDLIISEYIEGSSNNKYIEIYNGTGSSVNLSGYKLQLFTNGSETVSSSLELSDIQDNLNNNKCLVIKNSSANLTLPEGVDPYSSAVANFNGNDAVALVKGSSEEFVDIFGVIGDILMKNEKAWTGEDGYTTENKTLVRKAHVFQGITTNPAGTGVTAFTTLTTEWDMYPENTVQYLGSHEMGKINHLVNQSAGNNLSYTVTGLDAGKNYFYVVRAADNYGQISEDSNEVAVTTLSAPVYDYPENTQVTLPFGGSLTFTAGNANNSGTALPPIPNTSISDYKSLALDLVGSGPWTIEIMSTLDYCSYNWQNNWYDAQTITDGFKISIDSLTKGAKDLFIVLSKQNPTLPIELSSFTVTQNSNGNPVISWDTQSETGVNGFYIYRGVNKNITEAALISNLVPATNSSLAHSYSFVDKDLIEDGTYYYWLNVSDLNGHESYYGPAELNYAFTESEETTPEVTYNTALKSIYPNPFNPSANIGFELAEAGEVNISVYNTRGQLVRSFAPFTHEMGQGSIVWDGKDNSGNSTSSGIYLFRMTVGAKSYSAKALMMK